MKKLLLIILSICICLSGCNKKDNQNQENEGLVQLENKYSELLNSVDYGSYTTNEQAQYITDAIYSKLDQELPEDEYYIEQVQSIYLSKEYLEEVAYNSKTNVFFGYSLQDLAEQYNGDPYVFTVDDNGETITRPFNAKENIYNQVIKNVAIGSGVILTEIVLVVATNKAGGFSKINIILTCSLVGGVLGATIGAAVSGIVAGIVKYSKTGDYDLALSDAMKYGSEGFKWGAIIGTVVGTAGGVYLATQIPSWQESESFIKTLYKCSAEQVSYLNGKEVLKGTIGSTRPDCIRTVDGVLEAIEVKNYDLINNLHNLCTTLTQEMTQRIANMPEGTIQRLVLDVRGRGYDKVFIHDLVIPYIKNKLATVCPELIIDVVGL